MKYLLIFVFLGFQILCASIIFDSNTKVVENFTLSYYIDNDRSLDISTLNDIDFEHTAPNHFTLDFVEGDVWFKFDIASKSLSNTYVLSFSEAFYDEVILYSFKEEKWIKQISTDMYPMFILDFSKNKKQKFYIKTHTKFETFGTFKFYKNYQTLIEKQTIVIIQYGIFFGGSINYRYIFTISLFTIEKKYLLLLCWVHCFLWFFCFLTYWIFKNI